MDDAGPVECLLAGSPALRAGSVDHGGWWNLTLGGVLNIYGDLTDEDCQRIASQRRIAQVQFGQDFPVSVVTWRALNDHVFQGHPEAALRYGWARPGDHPVDLAFLEYLPLLRGLTVWGNRPDLAPVREHGGIVRLGVVDGDLRSVASVGSIRTLWLGKGARHREMAGQLPNLEELTISGVTVTDLAHLAPLQYLRSLAIWFGGTRHFAELLKLRHLRRVDIWRVRHVEITDLTPLNEVTNLETLALRELPRVTNLSWLINSSIRNLELDLKNLAGLTSLAGLTGLERLAVHRPALDALTQLAQLPALRAVYGFPSPTAAPISAVEVRPVDFIGGQFGR